MTKDNGETWLAQLNAAQFDVISVAGGMAHLADCADGLGNTALADKLAAYSQRLERAAADIASASGAAVNDQLRASFEASDNMIRAALACVKAGEQSQ